MNAAFDLVGELAIELHGPDGVLKQRLVTPNLVVTAGKVVVAERLGNSAPTKAAMTHMGIGTTNTAPAAGDTALAAQAARVALTSATPSTNTVIYSATFGAGVGTGAIVEAGLFNASTSGDMLCRSVFSTINKGASDSLTITWTVTVN